MIIGKHSALKGFGLFLYAIVTILVLICTVNIGHLWGVVGICNTLVNSYVIYKLFAYFSNQNNTEK